MPAERMSGAVSVYPDPRAQSPRLGNQLLARHRFEALVHDTSLLHAYQRTALAIIGQPDVGFKMEGMTRSQDAGGKSWPGRTSTSSWAPRSPLYDPRAGP